MNLHAQGGCVHRRYELKLTAMIDVVFLLLIFFICTIKFRMPEGKIQSNLPEDSDAPIIEDIEQINIVARRAGDTVDLFINKDSFGSDFAAVEARLRSLRERFKKTGTPHIFIVDGSQDIQFQYVVTTINTCIRAGITDLSFAPPPTSAF